MFSATETYKQIVARYRADDMARQLRNFNLLITQLDPFQAVRK